jgi:lipid-A-disaccharide synthase
LKQKGIPTVHYVSPTIWAWRPGRIHTMRQAATHTLLLFPFEEKIYQEHGVPASFVGHTLASKIPLEIDKVKAKLELGLDPSKPVIGLFPGSRETEIKRIGS